MNKFFVQFFSKIKYSHPTYPLNIYELCNGFSDTWDLCKKMGNIIWIEHRLQEKTLGKSNLETYIEFPQKADEIYVSAFYISQLNQALLWAKEMPETKVIVGGPAALPKAFILEGELPDNFIITNKSVEEYFGIENFSYDWKLEIPEIEEKNYTLSYTYSVDTFCYWAKCIFCNYSLTRRRRPNINFTHFPKFKDGNQRINIYSPSPSPKFLNYALIRLPYHRKIRYDLYCRPKKGEQNAFKNLLENHIMKIPRLKVTIGVEFPSNRMLDYMRKGFTVEEILETIDIISNIDNLIINIPLILGWNNLTKDDLKCLENFMLKISKYNYVVNINTLFAKVFTPIHETYEIGKKQTFGPFYSGFFPKLNDKQKELNKEACSIIKDLAEGSTIYNYFERSVQ